MDLRFFVVCGALVAGACGASPAPAPSAPAQSSRAADPSADDPRIREAGGNPVLVEEIGDASLFVDEDRAIRAALTEWLAAHTAWRIVPADEVERARSRALAGQDLATGAVCGAPIHAHTALARAFGAYDAASGAVTCTEGPNDTTSLPCTFDVTVFRHRADAPKATPISFRAPIEGRPTATSIRAAVSKLALRRDGDGGMMGGLGMIVEEPIRSRDAVKVTLWADQPTDDALDDEAVLAPARAALDHCFSRSRHQEMFLLSIDAAGQVSRCEGRPWAPAPSRDCICDAMKGAAWPKATRRVAFDVVHQPKDVVVSGRAVRTWIEGGASSFAPPDLTTCFAGEALPGADVTTRVPFQFRIGDDLHPVELRIDWPNGFARPAARACTERVIRSTTFPCHERGEARRHTLAVR